MTRQSRLSATLSRRFYLARADLATQSWRSYSQTLNRVVAEIGDDSPLAGLDSDQLSDAIAGAWGDGAPATWNRHVATARSFTAFCQRHAWLPDAFAVGVERRREPADRTRAVPYAQLERLWRRDDVAMREKALWRLLYETAARASEILSLNIEDIDRDNRRAVVRSKGGNIDLLHFQTGSARLIPRLIGERARGPLFLTDRRPAPGPRPGSCRHLPVQRPRSAVLPPHRGALQRRVWQLDAAPAAPLGDHASRRGQRRPIR